jgi:hypothetical protein
MVDRNDRIVRAAADEGESLLVDDFVRLIEQYHDNDRAGVARETLDAYARRLEDERPDFDADAFLGAIDDRLTDDGYATDAFYRLDDDRVSVYPAQWHDDLGGETDLREYVRYLGALEPGAGAELGGAGRGVPEHELLDAVGVLGGTDPDAAKAELERLRDEGELVEDADQHPNARVRFPDTERE